MSRYQDSFELLDIRHFQKTKLSPICSIESSPNLSLKHKPCNFDLISNLSEFEIFQMEKEIPTRNNFPSPDLIDTTPTLIPHSSNNLVQPSGSATFRASGSKVIDNVGIENSSDVTFGNKTFYQGPVTIKQVVVNGSQPVSNEQPSIESSSEPPARVVVVDNFLSIHKRKIFGIFIMGVSIILITIIAVELLKWDELEPPTMTSIIPSTPFPSSPPRPPTTPLDPFTPFHTTSTSSITTSPTIATTISSQWDYPPMSEDENPINGLVYVTRSQWKAIPPVEQIEQLQAPPARVILYHTLMDQCINLAACIAETFIIQNHHIKDREFSDIGYNFLLGGEGRAYIGRGWDFVGAHTATENRQSIGIGFIGTFTNSDQVPTRKQVEGLRNLLDEGARLKKITSDYKIFPHKCVAMYFTESPGCGVINVVRNWTNYEYSPSSPPSQKVIVIRSFLSKHKRGIVGIFLIIASIIITIIAGLELWKLNEVDDQQSTTISSTITYFSSTSTNYPISSSTSLEPTSTFSHPSDTTPYYTMSQIISTSQPWDYPLMSEDEDPMTGLYAQRSQWKASAPSEQIEQLHAPPARVILYHTAMSNCYTLYTCIIEMSNIQEDHMKERGFSDIGYNFLLGGDGRAYIGRGWDFVGAHTATENRQSIGIAFIGTFTTSDQTPTINQKNALQELLDWGKHLGKITHDYKILPHKCVVTFVTESPGCGIIDFISNWTNYECPS